MKKRIIALYGTSLAMSTVAASLQQEPEFQVQEIKGKSSDLIDKLEAAPPDVILFDLSAAQPDFAVPLLRKHPGILLIEVDLMNNKMLLLSGEQSRLMTTEDLAKVVEGASTSKMRRRPLKRRRKEKKS
jgi:DNA-binding NarL/FixJ family response regulator